MSELVNDADDALLAERAAHARTQRWLEDFQGEFATALVDRGVLDARLRTLRDRIEYLVNEWLVQAHGPNLNVGARAALLQAAEALNEVLDAPELGVRIGVSAETHERLERKYARLRELARAVSEASADGSVREEFNRIEAMP